MTYHEEITVPLYLCHARQLSTKTRTYIESVRPPLTIICIRIVLDTVNTIIENPAENISGIFDNEIVILPRLE